MTSQAQSAPAAGHHRLRALFGAGIIYGAADLLALATAGYVLLPLYTHSLSQEDFGRYVAIRANLEFITAALHLGLLSALARVYFDFPDAHGRSRYVLSLLAVFGVWGCLAGTGMLAIGAPLWNAVSPEVPAQPYLAICLGLAAVSFLSQAGTTWLRLDGKAMALTATQVGSSVVLVVATWIFLQVIGVGLPGVFAAIGLASLAGIGVLAARLVSTPPSKGRWNVAESLRYALPALAGLLAYTLLNRASVMVLQRNAEVTDLAVFGLAQQLAMLVLLAGMALGKALQPAVWGSPADQAGYMLQKMNSFLLSIALPVTCGLILFAPEIVDLLAPPGYQRGVSAMIVLVLASFTYCLSIVSDTAILLRRRPGISALLTVAGACVAISAALVLVPESGVMGAAISTLLASSVVLAGSRGMAMKLGTAAELPATLIALLAAYGVAGLGIASASLPGFPASATVRSMILIVVSSAAALPVYRMLRTSRHQPT